MVLRQLTKEQAKEEAIQKLKMLVEDFKTNRDKYKSLSEPDIETKLVEELFLGVLGWSKNDFEKQPNVRRGDKRGRADYAFKIGEKIVFFLEVKKVGIPLDKEADKQVVSYALSRKNVPFAISTNFEQMKIFCVEQDKAYNNVFRVFRTPEEYLTKMQDLLLLSKESFEKNELLSQAEAEDRLKKRITIDKMLLEDLMDIRKLIADDIEKRYPDKYNINEQDEIVQRIIDRLIFIRRAEDIGIQPNDLRLEDIKHLSGDKAYPKLKEIFKEYNSAYDGGLFDPNYDNDCDKIIIDGEKIKKLIYLLYESKDGYIYNFDWIDADVLGQVYEQYLGKILAQTKSGKAKLKEGQAHRKEQGIYYTPTYVVDYIVKNTVGELLKDKKVDPTKIKILDPACGSGSFLIKAYDYLAKHIINKGDDAGQYRLDEQGHYSVKTEILKNNIYGVDLDQKAVEITKLNLLLKAAEKNRKLPKEVDLHIRHGNSLIDDETVAGSTAFKWDGDFKEGSFDIVIGNPPYIRNTELPEKDKKFFNSEYESAYKQYDILVLFFEKAIKILKNKGYFGFITSNKFMASEYGKKLRDVILKKCTKIKFIDVSNLRVFKDVSTYPVITIFQKSDETKSSNDVIMFKTVRESSQIFEKNNFTIIHKIKIIELGDNSFLEDVGSLKHDIIKKIDANGTKIENLFSCQRGTQKNKIQIVESPAINCILSKGVDRYSPNVSKDVFVVSNLQDAILSEEKILIPRTVLNVRAAYDSGNHFIMDRIYFLIPKEKSKFMKTALAILNSKLIDFYYKFKFGSTHVAGGYLDLNGVQIESIPIILKESQELNKLVDKNIDYHTRLNQFGDKQTSERAKIEEEIMKLDNEIDEEVYKFYGITEEEKKIINKSLK